MASTSLQGSMRASLLGSWHQAKPYQRLGYLIGGALILVGVAPLAVGLGVGGSGLVPQAHHLRHLLRANHHHPDLDRRAAADRRPDGLVAARSTGGGRHL